MGETSIDTVATRTGDKRLRILRAAVEEFAQCGYFNTRVAAIAKRAGVADGTIYLYFSGKEEILITIFRERMREFLGRLETVLADAGDATAKLRRTVALHLSESGDDRDLAIVFQVELRHSLKFMTLFTSEELAEYLDCLRGIVEQGQREGVFQRSIHPHLAAKAIFGVLDEMVTSWILSEKGTRLDESSEAVADLVLGGMLAAE